jgi:hypothetical protein
MYQLPALKMMRMISVPLATKSPCAHSAFRPYGLSMDVCAGVDESCAMATGEALTVTASSKAIMEEERTEFMRVNMAGISKNEVERLM